MRKQSSSPYLHTHTCLAAEAGAEATEAEAEATKAGTRGNECVVEPAHVFFFIFRVSWLLNRPMFLGF
jgi:hypothetical protein